MIHWSGKKDVAIGKEEGIGLGFIKLYAFLVSIWMVLYLAALHILIYFPRMAYNFLCAEPVSLGPGENPASCFHPQMWFSRDEVCAVCHAENPAILIRDRDSLSISTWHSLSHSLPPGHSMGLLFLLSEYRRWL